MPDKDRRSFDERVRCGEGVISIINQPIDFAIDFVVQPKCALDRARYRWLCEPGLIVGGLNERTDRPAGR